jgi:hypothetical protein
MDFREPTEGTEGLWDQCPAQLPLSTPLLPQTQLVFTRKLALLGSLEISVLLCIFGYTGVWTQGLLLAESRLSTA